MATKVSEATIDRVKACLEGTPQTYKQVAAVLGLTVQTTHLVTKVLYERRQIYAKDFQRCARNGNMVPIYAVGNEADAELPEIAAKRKHSHEYLNRERAWLRESRGSGGAPFRSWLDVALFGAAPLSPSRRSGKAGSCGSLCQRTMREKQHERALQDRQSWPRLVAVGSQGARSSLQARRRPVQRIPL